ncbi:MAG: ATP-binding protein [Bacteroidota bacterium]
MKRILITGPESTGKSELARSLSLFYGGLTIPEYAREYISLLGRPYLYRDVERIALKQLKEYESSDHPDWIFFDTWLIITKVWFEFVYGSFPAWMEEKIRKARFDLVLLCDTDIPWIADQVRENGGTRREELLSIYKKELDYFSLDWELVRGKGDERFHCARVLIDKKLAHGTT